MKLPAGKEKLVFQMDDGGCPSTMPIRCQCVNLSGYCNFISHSVRLQNVSFKTIDGKGKI